MHMLLSVSENVPDSTNHIFDVLEANPVFFEIILGVITTVIGVLGIVLSIDNYIQRKQTEARFGFYINLLIYIKNFNYYLSNYPEITDFLVKKDLRNAESSLPATTARIEEIKPLFVALCNNFLDFIHSAQNNIPPHAKPDTKEWKKWYKDIIDLSEFLQKCLFISTNLTPYISLAEVNSYNKEVAKIKKIVSDLEKSLSKTLEK